MLTSTIPEFVTNEVKRALRRAHTFEALLDYLPKHVGETFTCADLRKLYPDFSSHVAAQWLSDSQGYALGAHIKVNGAGAEIVLETPVVVDCGSWYDWTTHEYHKAGPVAITKYTVNSYTILGMR